MWSCVVLFVSCVCVCDVFPLMCFHACCAGSRLYFRRRNRVDDPSPNSRRRRPRSGRAVRRNSKRCAIRTRFVKRRYVVCIVLVSPLYRNRLYTNINTYMLVYISVYGLTYILAATPMGCWTKLKTSRCTHATRLEEVFVFSVHRIDRQYVV